MNVGVIGCGTAGAACAIFMARAGHDVTVLERVAEPKPVGAGIIIQPTGQTVLARLGLLAKITERGARLERLFLRTPRQRTLVDLRYAAVDATWFGIGIHRGVLFEALYDTVRTEPRITLATGVAVRGLRRDGAVTYAVADHDGAEPLDTRVGANDGIARREYGPFDLVVVADGSVSELRGAAGATSRDAAYPWGALWFVAEDPDRVFAGELYQIASRARRLYGVLPTGLGPRGDVPVVSLFWSLAAHDLDAWRAAGLDAWKAEVRALDPRIAFVLDRVTSLDQLVFARYRDVAMKRWHDRGIVFIGDAAHATSPQLGQGANLALVDAMVLADALASSGKIDPAQAGTGSVDGALDAATTTAPRDLNARDHDTPAAIDAALETYSRARRRHLRHYQRMTRILTPFFQSDSRFYGWLRDWTFPIANALPPLRNHMVRTMAGVSLGFGRSRLLLR